MPKYSKQKIQEVKNMKRMLVFLLCAIFLTVGLNAQEKAVVEVNGIYGGGLEGSLNDAVKTVLNTEGTLSNTVFKLKSNDWYVMTGVIEVPVGQVLELVGEDIGATQETSPPQMLWTASTSVNKTFMIAVYGDLIMKNIWVRFVDVAGVQTGTPIVFDGDTTGQSPDDKEEGYFENCIFEYMPCPVVTASGSICIRCKHFNGTFKNCYFRNCVDRHFMYYGRAVSYPFDVPGYHTDYISFENCTFANMGYVLMQEGSNWGENVHFNHCTFYNTVQFPLESGWWWKLNVTNCLFVNAWMMGYIPLMGAGSATISIEPADSIDFDIPFTDQDRHILFAHSAYYIDDWLVDWMHGGWELPFADDPDSVERWRPPSRITQVGSPYSRSLYKERAFNEIPYPRPMLDSTALMYFDSTDSEGKKVYPYINRAALYSVEDLRNAVNPRLIVPPLNLEPLKYFLNEKWGTNLDTMWAYEPLIGHEAQCWPLPENLAYANDTLKTAGMGGFPLGDLYNWWNPTVREGATDYYSAWLAQADDERAKIAQWLETGVHPDSVQNAIKSQTSSLSKFSLAQNYPNPFNPTTQIKYTVPYDARVSLKVYNTLGQEVANLVDGTQSAGEHIVTFDGKNLAGGIYFYTLKSEGVNITKKLVLIK